MQNIFMTWRDVIFYINHYIEWSDTAKDHYLCDFTEPGAMYEIQLVAFNGNGDSMCNKRLVSLAESGTGDKNSAGEWHYTHLALTNQFILGFSFSSFIDLHKGWCLYIIFV